MLQICKIDSKFVSDVVRLDFNVVVALTHVLSEDCETFAVI